MQVAHKQPISSNQPNGQSPTIVDGDFALEVWSDSAVSRRKVRQNTLSSRATLFVTQWVLFANATLGPAIFVKRI